MEWYVRTIIAYCACASIRAIPLLPPNCTTTGDVVTIDEGDSVCLVCPLPNITTIDWRVYPILNIGNRADYIGRNNKMAPYYVNDGRYNYTKYRDYLALTISTVRLVDAGVYDCSEDGFFDSSYGKVTLHVSISNSPVDLTIKDGTDAILSCTRANIYGDMINWIYAPARNKTYWTRIGANGHGYLFPSTIREVSDRSIRLSDRNNAGLYACISHVGTRVYDRRIYDVLSFNGIVPSVATTPVINNTRCSNAFDGYCANGGSCYADNDTDAYCTCTDYYYGLRCELSDRFVDRDESYIAVVCGLWTAITSTIIVLVSVFPCTKSILHRASSLPCTKSSQVCGESPTVIFETIPVRNDTNPTSSIYGIASHNEIIYLLRDGDDGYIIEVYGTEHVIRRYPSIEIPELSSCHNNGLACRSVTAPDSPTYLYVNDYIKDTIHVIDVATSDIVSSWTVGNGPIGLAVSNITGNVIVTCSMAKMIQIYAASDFTHVVDIEFFPLRLDSYTPIHAIEFGIDKYKIAVQSRYTDAVTDDIITIERNKSALNTDYAVVHEGDTVSSPLRRPTHLASYGNRIFVSDCYNNRILHSIDNQLQYIELPHICRYLSKPKCMYVNLSTNKLYIGELIGKLHDSTNPDGGGRIFVYDLLSL